MKPKRFLLPVLAILLIAAATVSTLAAASALPGREATRTAVKKRPAMAKVRKQERRRHVNPAVVRRFRSAAWRWQALMGVRRTQSYASLRSRRALRYWSVQARRMGWLAAHPPHKSA